MNISQELLGFIPSASCTVVHLHPFCIFLLMMCLHAGTAVALVVFLGKKISSEALEGGDEI